MNIFLVFSKIIFYITWLIIQLIWFKMFVQHVNIWTFLKMNIPCSCALLASHTHLGNEIRIQTKGACTSTNWLKCILDVCQKYSLPWLKSKMKSMDTLQGLQFGVIVSSSTNDKLFKIFGPIFKQNAATNFEKI